MPENVVKIVRYPNRRFYDRQASQYISLQDIDAIVRAGKKVEILDSQTNEDLTRSVLTRILMERQPEKMQLFPVEMLHFILRSNEVMTDFLRDYFRHSLTYLSYLQQHSTAVGPMAQPMHWAKAWLDGVARLAADDEEEPESEPLGSDAMAERIAQLEQRLRQLEQQSSDGESWSKAQRDESETRRGG